MRLKASIKNIKLPDAPPPTRATYKKPVIYNNLKHMRVVELPCQYNPRPAPLPKPRPQKKKSVKRRDVERERHYSKRKSWTEDRIVQLIDLYDDGLPFSEIGEKMGCSTKVAYTMISKLRDEGRVNTVRCQIGWTEEQNQKLIELYNAGVVYVDIAQAVSKSLSSTGMRIQKLKDKGVLHERNIRRRNNPADNNDRRDV